MSTMCPFRSPRTRAVIVHYHLFKNAGTSIERMLRESFGRRWASWDREVPGARISGADLQEWIERHPAIAAVSSHQIVPPVPRGDLAVVPIVFLREPLLRARSAWLFEWQKQPGLKAPKGSLANYVEEKFALGDIGVIANFQVSRLCNGGYEDARQKVHRHDEVALDAACRFVDSLPFVGLVEHFGESLGLLEETCREHFPGFIAREHRENVLESGARSPEQRLERLRRDLGGELFDELCLRNRLDSRLHEHALERFRAQLERRAEVAGSANLIGTGAG